MLILSFCIYIISDQNKYFGDWPQPACRKLSSAAQNLLPLLLT